MKLLALLTSLVVAAPYVEQAAAGDMPPDGPPIESEPACTWTKKGHGEWLCTSKVVLNTTGECTIVFKAGRVVVTAISMEIVSRQDPDNPAYLRSLVIERVNSPVETVISGVFLRDKVLPPNLACNISARLIVR
jgi:hypothetical protein